MDVTGKRGRPPKAGRREEVLEASLALVARTGIEALTLGELAAELGVSTYVLTYHFGSKDRLLAAIVELVETRFQAELAALAGELTPAELLRRYWAAASGESADGMMRLWLEIVVLASRDPGRFPGFLERAALGWREALAPVLGGAGRAGAREAATLVAAAVTGLEVHRLMEPGRADAAMGLLVSMLESGAFGAFGTSAAESG
ncbi:hypothetical protein Psi01_61470 [Planobispora siamensis]|uniref:HTH tetR-type domain-containing protein n=1 Tax=Planobispora siamensis TaxID=936338 RepID=A0A8J3SME7_9ACTN|nr:hypothetical protein Psi01_61470 [Planobispora siamensis]